MKEGPNLEGLGNQVEILSCWGWTIAIIGLERGIPSKCKSLACVDYVPALCTHRPSLLPIGWFSESFGGERTFMGGDC